MTMPWGIAADGAIRDEMSTRDIIIELLKKRGITSPQDIEEFLSVKPQRTYNPFLLPDMEAGVDLILSETDKGSRICVYGDYDADGITAAALMLTVLSCLTDKKNLQYYIPSRFEEGYGLNVKAIDKIKSSGCDMIITVDCGSVSRKEVEYAKSIGMKILVTDHHNVTGEMADCLLINPKRPDSEYPFRDLCGCGVAFKMAQALQNRGKISKHILTQILDLAAIGTVGDVMPLIDENRTITKFGLRVINTGSRPGLRKLIEGASLKAGEITSENIGFVLVPHLNAAGRMGDASRAVELLLTETGVLETEKEGETQKTDDMVKGLLQDNISRRKLQDDLFEKCCERIDSNGPDDLIILRAGSKYEGIAGIVAGKIKETYYRPAIILTPAGSEQEYLKGTGRGIESLNLYELLKTQEHLFEKFGGHSGACGFSMKKENLSRLKKGLAEEMKQLLQKDSELFVKKHPAELELSPSDATLELAEQIELLAPFGNMNPNPLISFRGEDFGEVQYMGEGNRHVRFNIYGSDNSWAQCVLFGRADEYNFLNHGRLTVTGALRTQTWQGKKRLQIMAEEIQFDEQNMQ